MPDLNLLPLHPANTPAFGDVGWYEHRGRIYLEGVVYYGGLGGDPGGVIVPAGGLPPAARPATPTAVTLYHDGRGDRLYGHFMTFDATIGTDGAITVTFTGAPPLASADNLVDLYLILGNTSWVSAVVDDSLSLEPLDPWLFELTAGEPTPTASSQGAVIGAHEGRVHLDGAATQITGSGNLIVLDSESGALPDLYRPLRFDKLAIPRVAGGWWPASFDPGSLAYGQMASRPLLRALSQPGGALYRQAPAGVWAPATDAVLSAGSLSLGSGPDADEWGIVLGGVWSAPDPSAAPGTEFGVVLAYGGRSWYRVGVEKRGDNGWYLVMVAYCADIGPPVGVTAARIDQAGSEGELPNGYEISAMLELDLTVGRSVRLKANDRGTVRTLVWPSGGLTPPVLLPADYAASAKWGIYFTPGVSTFENVTGDYYEVNGNYPPNWLPDYGYAVAGDQFDLSGVGWRALEPAPELPPSEVAIGAITSGFVPVGGRPSR